MEVGWGISEYTLSQNTHWRQRRLPRLRTKSALSRCCLSFTNSSVCFSESRSISLYYALCITSVSSFKRLVMLSEVRFEGWRTKLMKKALLAVKSLTTLPKRCFFSS